MKKKKEWRENEKEINIFDICFNSVPIFEIKFVMKGTNSKLESEWTQNQIIKYHTYISNRN